MGKRILSKIDYLSGTKPRKEYYAESHTIDGMVRVSNMERQITEVFSDFLNKLSGLRYDINNNGVVGGYGYGQNFSAEDLAEIAKTKQNMKEFAEKKLTKATEIVELLFNQVAPKTATVVIGKVEDKKDDEKAPSADVEDSSDEEDTSEEVSDVNAPSEKGIDKDNHFYDKKENEFSVDYNKLKSLLGKSVCVLKKTGGTLYGDLTAISTDKRSFTIGASNVISIDSIKDIKVMRGY